MPGPSKTALRPQSADNLRANLLKRKDQAQNRQASTEPVLPAPDLSLTKAGPST
jgi:hypothetical protein